MLCAPCRVGIRQHKHPGHDPGSAHPAGPGFHRRQHLRRRQPHQGQFLVRLQQLFICRVPDDFRAQCSL